MSFALEHLAFDTFTIVDSDQLAIRPNYSQYLASYLERKDNIGLLSNAPQRHAANTTVPPARHAHNEFELWRPFLRRFPHGEDKFVHWSYWPSTVFTVDAARALTKIFENDLQLQEIMRRTKIWASEEIILPTLVALLGYEIAAPIHGSKSMQPWRKQRHIGSILYRAIMTMNYASISA
jgi:hypothetical protein